MKKKLMVLSGFALGLFLPVAVFAATAGNSLVGTNSTTCGGAQLGPSGTKTITDLLCQVSSLLNAVIPVLIALGVVYFVWGVIQYVIASDEEAKKKGRNSIIWGLVGLAVIIAMWGLVHILSATFVGDSGNNQSVSLPGVNY